MKMLKKQFESVVNGKNFFLFLYAAVFAYLLQISWMKWPDPWVDFGYFLYNAREVSRGARLGIDITYNYGPLAIQIYGFLFKLFGANILSVFIFNFFLLLADTILVHFIFTKISRFVGVIATLVFISLFSFGQYLYQGNYNLMAPYKPEVAVGTTIMLFFLFFLLKKGKKNLFLLGVLAGSLLLTSSEFAVASIALSFVYFLSRWQGSKDLLKFSLGALLLPLIAVIFLEHKLYAFRAIIILFNKNLLFIPLLSKLMGVDQPILNILNMLEACGALLAGVALFVGLWNSKYSKYGMFLSVVIFFACTFLLYSETKYWLLVPRTFTILSIVCFLYWLKDRKNLFLGLWSAFSIAMLLRMILHPILHYYGFTLLMPSALLMVYVLGDPIPQYIEKKNLNGAGAKIFLVLIFFSLSFVAAKIQWPLYTHRTYSISNGKNPLFDWDERYLSRGPAITELLSYLKTNGHKNDLVLGLPDGHMVNFLLDLPRPQPYSLSAGDLSDFGEDHILESYKKSAPKFIFISKKEPYDDSGGFGETYGEKIIQWVLADYKKIQSFQNDKIILFQRNRI